MIDRKLVGVDVDWDFDGLSPDTIDPRLAPTETIREQMVNRRKQAGLSDYPSRPLATQCDVDRILERSRTDLPQRVAKLIAD
jgi:hypothetical protein